MRTRLNYSQRELLRKPWVLLQIEMADLPSADYSKEDDSIEISTPEQAANSGIINKLKNRKKKK